MPTLDDMSLLQRMVARLSAQAVLIDAAAVLIADVAGPVLEVGLGKGRTYDHLRRRLPGRTILAFDRELHAPATVAPAADQLVLGEFAVTLPATAARIGRTAALAHADFGSPDRAADARQALSLAPLLQRLVRPGGIVLADRAMTVDGWVSLPTPPGLAWPYYMWRVQH